MQDTAFEQILVLIVFFLVALLQVYLERRRKRVPGTSPEEEPEWSEVSLPPPSPATDSSRRPGEHAIEVVAPRPQGRSGFPGMAPSPPARTARRDLRRAIVWSVILGPCRAKDPPL